MSNIGFWREIKQDGRDINIQSNRLGKIGRPWYIFPQGNGPRGAFTNFTDLAPNLRSRDIIILGGVLREQAVAPLDVYDVTIYGAANLPRQATSGGVPTGGGACWIPPTSPVATTPLLELRAQGWAFENIEFTPVNASAAVRLTRSASVDTIDASHVRFSSCFFAGNGGTTQIGIEDNGGCRSAIIEDCRFESLAGVAIKGLNTAAAVPQDWRISENKFRLNGSDIVMSLNFAQILKNDFFSLTGSGERINTIAIAAQGASNHVLLNQFADINTDITPSDGYTGSTTDVWNNYAAGTAALIVVSPPT